MAETSYDSVSVLLFDPDMAARTGARYALQSVGITRIDEHTSLATVPDSLEVGDYDLLVLDCTVGTRGVFELTREIRTSQRGQNPFVTIILTVWQPSEAVVFGAMNAGADDLVVKPFSANLIAHRLTTLTGHRKPFVFNDNYAGPVRRMEASALRTLAPVEVPNTLRAKVRDEHLTPMTPALVNSVINFQHCKRLEARLQSAIDGVLTYFAKPENTDFPIGLVSEMLVASEELAELTRDGGLGAVTEMCATLKGVATQIQAQGAAAGQKNIQVLEATAAAIKTALSHRDDVARAAGDIAETMRAVRDARPHAE